LLLSWPLKKEETPQIREASPAPETFAIMIAFTFALFIVSFAFKRGKVTRIEGGLLVSAFAAYLYMLYLQA